MVSVSVGQEPFHWVLAGGLSSSPWGPLQRAAWVSFQRGSWLPPERVIREREEAWTHLDSTLVLHRVGRDRTRAGIPRQAPLGPSWRLAMTVSALHLRVRSL